MRNGNEEMRNACPREIRDGQPKDAVVDMADIAGMAETADIAGMADMVVIADDITGAAEIAGIAYTMGHQVSLLCASDTAGNCSDTVGNCSDTAGNCSDMAENCHDTSAAVTVIATDTRSMTESEAIAETRRIAESFLLPPSSLLPPRNSPRNFFLLPPSSLLPPRKFPRNSFLLYKKTDSALRGHVVAELRALMQAVGYRRSVYLPANPSKGRIIRHGIYYIKEVRGESREMRGESREVREAPIHETAFSYDPEFPAHTSSMCERFPDAEASGIVMPDAETADDIRHAITHYNDGHTLFAGAADLFKELLEVRGERQEVGEMLPRRDYSLTSHLSPLTSKSSHLSPLTSKSSILLLCGSTQSRPLDLGIPIAAMPREVYDGQQGADFWLDQLSTPLPHREGLGEGPLGSDSLILTIPYTHRTGKSVAIHLRSVMAEMTRRLVARHRPDHLIIEGGATAWATLQALGWTSFEVTGQIAPGVVQMRSVTSGVLVTLKPGSYPWGGLFKV